jgi:hypothetical protein
MSHQDYGVSYEGTNEPLVRMKSKENLQPGQYYFDDETGVYTFCDPKDDPKDILIHSHDPYFSETITFKCSDCGKETTACRRDRFAWDAAQCQKLEAKFISSGHGIRYTPGGTRLADINFVNDAKPHPLCKECYSKLGPWYA